MKYISRVYNKYKVKYRHSGTLEVSSHDTLEEAKARVEFLLKTYPPKSVGKPPTPTGFVYMWINNINEMWYIGSHQGSEDDGYISSGEKLLEAIEEYGIENFERHIVFTGTIEEVRKKEHELLTEMKAATEPQSYNRSNYAGTGVKKTEAELLDELEIRVKKIDELLLRKKEIMKEVNLLRKSIKYFLNKIEQLDT